MNDPFYASIKLVTGEEVLAETVLSNENGVEFFLLNGAITIEEKVSIDSTKGVAASALTPKRWPFFSSDDMAIIHMDKVVTITELDIYGERFYKKALINARVSSPVKRKMDSIEHSGYLGSVESIRESLEKLYLD